MKLGILLAALCIATLSSALPASAQSDNDLKVLQGLSPVADLSNSYAGQAALGANFIVTGGIQTGDIRQSLLLPFAEQQQQALRDVFITDANLAQLSDGLGTALGSAYLARFHYIDRTHSTPTAADLQTDPATAAAQSKPPLLKDLVELIAYANATTGTSSNSGKYFFANATTDGTTPVSQKALDIFKNSTKHPDMFGRAYNLPGGSPNADKFGNSRPFQTEPTLTRIFGRDYFGTPADNIVYNRGPMMSLTNSPSYPSGHTTYGYMGSLVLAVLVPDRYPEMMVRAAEYGNDRIIIGAHYAMDVIGGRTLALYDLAHLLANDEAFMDKTFTYPKNTPRLNHFREHAEKTRAELKPPWKQPAATPSPPARNKTPAA